jgi:hypothetical protein
LFVDMQIGQRLHFAVPDGPEIGDTGRRRYIGDQYCALSL